MRQFVLADACELPRQGFPSGTFTRINFFGTTFDEDRLRDWATARFGVDPAAPLAAVVTAAKHGGFFVLEILAGSDPSGPDPARTPMACGGAAR